MIESGRFRTPTLVESLACMVDLVERVISVGRRTGGVSVHSMHQTLNLSLPAQPISSSLSECQTDA